MSSSDVGSPADGPALPVRGPRPPYAVFGGAVRPLTRTVGFYARSWRDYLSNDERDELPVVRPTAALAGQAFRDEIVLAGFRILNSVADAGTFAAIDREVRAALELYEARGWLQDPATFHDTPPPLHKVAIEPVSSGRRSHERVTFPSGYEPHPDEPGRDRWLGYTANRQVSAWMLRHNERRPWVICVHGAGMGRSSLDLSIFRARWLHEELGLNVIGPVLPLHGPRGRGTPKGTGWPADNVLDNVHGAAQAVWDIRRLISWIRAEDDDPSIGLSSISMGGYVTALVSSLEEGLTAAILGVPVVDLGDLLERHYGFASEDSRRSTIELASQLTQVVSPLALQPLVPPRGRFIYAGLADQLVHPRQQVFKLWEHWGRPEIGWYQGGHTGFFRSKPVQRFVLDALLHADLVDPSSRVLRRR